MSCDLYSGLLTKTWNSNEHSFSETSSSYQFLRERHLQAMWLEQKYFNSLSTSKGLAITVLSPGIWNGEAGPDFLRAHIIIGDQEFRGDIEIHLYDEGWFHHHHHLDEKYNQVILHVGYWKPKTAQSLTTLEGKDLPRTYLEEKLTVPEARLLKLIDLDLYPYKHFVGSGSCANTLFRNLPSQSINRFFRQAAAWRLEQKHQHFQAKIENPSEFLIGGIAMALGYKHNADKFLQMYFLLKQYAFMDESTLLAYAIGLSGFFKEKYRKQWMYSIKYQALAWRYDAMAPPMKTHLIALNLERTRPANHPIRRLAILVKMILDANSNCLHKNLCKLWQDYWPAATKQARSFLCKAFIETLPTYEDAYWEHHYIFEERPKSATVTLLGDDLKREIIINSYLPLLYCEIKLRNNPQEKEAFFNFYNTFPASKTRKGTYLMHRFFGDTHKKTLLKKADMQQGAYQLHRDFCIHFEASCVGCPFVNRYNATFGSV